MMPHLYSKHIKLVYVAVMATMLAGCQIWPDYMRPKVAVPAQYSEPEQGSTGQASSQVASDWWKLYQDQTLNDLVEKALQNNTDIKLAVARIEEADAVMREVGAALFPRVDLDAAGTRSRVTEAGAFPAFGDNPRNNYSVQLGTSFEIDFWGKLRNAKESARAQALSTRYAKDTVALSLSSLVVSNYLVLRSLESQIAVAQDNLKSRDESLALTKRRLDGGVASALDVHQAEVASANLTAQLAELTRLRALSMHQLAVLTGVLDLNVAMADIKTLPIPPTPPAGLPSSLLEARPDVRQAEQTMIAADANIGVAKAALYPTISLTASLGGESLELGDILKSAARIWTGGLSLNLPIFDSGRLNSRVDQASAKQKQALASYEGAIQNAFREVNDALVNLRQNSEREAALNRGQEAAKKALEVSENRYKSGYSAYLDVLDAQRVYNDTALAFIQSRQARLVATVELFKALGGGWKADNKEQAKSGS
ncbi:MAG TPA: efflux transporter outer membrane subunit [Methylotenera sp.]|nr:efflux transporter outer membrane subunit [Methylotenera sp.]